MVAPKPVSIVTGTAASFVGEAEPLAIVGALPIPTAQVKALTAVPATFADLAAVRTYLNTLVTEIKASDYFS